MFTDGASEIQPPDWRQIPKNRLGKGRTARCIGQSGVASKLRKSDDCPKPKNERDVALEAHKKKLQKITKDFVKEVDVGCELLHPNLVQMLGYATEPMLVILGAHARGSLDKQRMWSIGGQT